MEVYWAKEKKVARWFIFKDEKFAHLFIWIKHNQLSCSKTWLFCRNIGPLSNPSSIDNAGIFYEKYV